MDTTCRNTFLHVREVASLKGGYSEVGFNLGFMAGQCEKVALGACVACMVRPRGEEEYLDSLIDIIEACGLEWLIHTPEPDRVELWALKPKNYQMVDYVLGMAYNSPQYHLGRGILCGVPADEIDFNFHERMTA